MSKFDKDWSFQQKMQKEYALDLYREQYPECEIVEVDTEGQDERVAKLFDFSGVDKMIEKQSGTTVLLSQRFRRKSVGNDFSLTYSRPHTTNPVEFERLHLALKDDYAMMPKVYGFGVADDIKNGKSSDRYAYEQGFESFYMFDMELLVKSVANETIDFFVPNSTSNGNGNRAAYIDPTELEKAGAIINSWGHNCDDQSGLDDFA